MEAKSPWHRRFAAGLRHAFALDGPCEGLTDDDRQLLHKLARGIVVRGMGMPAVLLLESVRPLNAIGSQAMVFLRPFLTAVFKPAEYDRLSLLLERRETLSVLIEAIEADLAREKELVK